VSLDQAVAHKAMSMQNVGFVAIIFAQRAIAPTLTNSLHFMGWWSATAQTSFARCEAGCVRAVCL